MNGKKRLMQSVAVMGLTSVLTLTASFSQIQNTKSDKMIQLADNGRAGIVSAFAGSETVLNVWERELTLEQTDVTLVGASGVAAAYEVAAEAVQADVEAENTEETEKKETTKKADKTKKWANKLMANVDDFLYIRESNNSESAILGKLRKGDVAKILKAGKNWSKIQSGSVTGYVKNEFCVVGEEAYKLASKICDTVATVETSGLRVRTKANKNANVVQTVAEGDKLVVNTDTKEKDGWVAVTVDGSEGYVSEEYVTVALGTNDAISLEEEQKIIEEQKKAEAAEAAAKQQAAATTVQSTQQAATTTVQNTPSTASGDELSLLAAIIYCEAGGESYEGQVAVGAVVLNRVRSGSFPSSISAVIQQGGQFSPVASGAFSSALANGYYQNCISAAQSALAGNDPTGGALYFHRNGGGTAGVVIGHHVFY